MTATIRPAAYADGGRTVTAVEVTLGHLTVEDVERALAADTREWPLASDAFPRVDLSAGFEDLPAGVRCRDEWVSGSELRSHTLRIHPDDVPAPSADDALVDELADDLVAAWQETNSWFRGLHLVQAPDFRQVAATAIAKIRATEGPR